VRVKDVLLIHLFVFAMPLFALRPAGADTRTVSVPLEIAADQGCKHDAWSALLLRRIAVPDEQGRIALEAEAASRYFLNPAAYLPNAKPPHDAEASGGRFLDRFVYARYDFRVERRRKLDFWVRLASPVGHSRFRAVLNGSTFAPPFHEHNQEKPQPYHWVKCGTLTARPGLNRLELTSYGGRPPRIDKLLLLPAGAKEPEDFGPARKSVPVDAGRIETTPSRVPGLRRLVKLQGLPADGAKVGISTDDGATWTPVAGAPDLSGVAVPPNADVRFRIDLQRTREDKPPDVAMLSLVAEVDPEEYIELRNETTRFVFDRAGGLFSVACTATGDFVVWPVRPRPLAAVEFKKQGEGAWLRVGPERRTRITTVEGRRKGLWDRKEAEPEEHPVPPEAVTVSQNRLEVRYLFDVPGTGKARMTCTVEPWTDGLWRFAVTVQSLEGPADVTGVMFPIFEHVRVGASGLDDHQLRLQSFGHHAIQPGKGPLRDTRYLGSSVMPWTEVFDDRTGFYVCPYDPQALNVLYNSRASGPAGEHFSMSTTKMHQIKPGETRTWEYAVAAHPGDWHWGADRYRKWFYSVHGKADYPRWMYTCDGWIALQAENYGRGFRFSQLPDWLTRARAVGLDWVQVWGQFAYDGGPCCCPVYPLSPLYGGEQGWKDGVRKVTARKGRIGGYFVYDRMDILPMLTDYYLGHFKLGEYPPGTPWPKPELIRRVRLIRDPTGTVPPWPPKEDDIAAYRDKIKQHQAIYAEGRRARPVMWWVPVYLDDPLWREYLRFWIVDKYQKEYGCNSVYIDVLGCGGAAESFDPRRGHNGDGRWGIGKLNIARTVVEAARKADPDFAATMEGLGDLPGLFFAPMCSGVYRGGRNVYRYTFPERIMLHGVTNPGSGGTAMDRYLETFLEGMRYDIVGRPGALPLYFMRLTRQFTPRLYEAVFRDTVGLKAENPRIRARLHLETNGGALLTIVNRERLKGVRVTLDRDKVGDVQAAFFAGLSGAAGKLPLERRTNEAAFKAPDETASIVMLPTKTSAAKGPAVWPVFYLRRPAPPAGRVTLFNLSAETLKGTCSVEVRGFTEPFQERLDEARDSLPFTRTSEAVELQPWQAKDVSFPIRSLRKHRWTVRVAVKVDMGPNARITRTFFVTPLVLDGSWEVRGTPEETAPDGERTLTLPPTDSGYLHQLVDIWAEPDRRYRLQVKAKRSGFTAKVWGTLLMVTDPTTRCVWEYRKLDKNRPGEWQTLTYEFRTPRELTRAGIYLYNVVSPDTAWFDDLYVEEK